MSLYDDVVTDFGTGSSTKAENSPAQTDIASTWSTNSLKLLQFQVEAAKKRQQLNSLHAASNIKRDKPSASIAPVIDLSDKKKPQLQLRKDPESYLSPLLTSASFASSKPEPKPTNPAEYVYPKTNTPSFQTPIDLRFNSITGKIEKEDGSLYANVNEEYDPMRPNDYEKLTSERALKLKNSSQNNGSSEEKGSSHNRHRSARDKSHKRSGSSSDDDSRGNRKRKHDDEHKPQHYNSEAKRGGAAFAPPPSLFENDNKSSNEHAEDSLASRLPTTPKNVSAGLFKAEKMMAKMGYKEGEGLGKNKQGMSMALQVEKTGMRSGRIIHEKDIVAEPVAPIVPPLPVASTPAPSTTGASPAVGIPAEVMKNMSKVILLKNMVSPGDVDEDLEGETKEECQKYGEVTKVIIYEMPNHPQEEAVRIFVEFKTLPSAIKALTDLNGRFFGGRIVKATFYNLDKFKRLELADDA